MGHSMARNSTSSTELTTYAPSVKRRLAQQHFSKAAIVQHHNKPEPLQNHLNIQHMSRERHELDGQSQDELLLARLATRTSRREQQSISDVGDGISVEEDAHDMTVVVSHQPNESVGMAENRLVRGIKTSKTLKLENQPLVARTSIFEPSQLEPSIERLVNVPEGEKRTCNEISSKPNGPDRNYLWPSRPLLHPLGDASYRYPTAHACSFCPRKFSYLEDLKRHLKIHSNSNLLQMAAAVQNNDDWQGRPIDRALQSPSPAGPLPLAGPFLPSEPISGCRGMYATSREPTLSEQKSRPIWRSLAQQLTPTKDTISRDETKGDVHQERQLMQTLAIHIQRNQGLAHRQKNSMPTQPRKAEFSHPSLPVTTIEEESMHRLNPDMEWLNLPPLLPSIRKSSEPSQPLDEAFAKLDLPTSTVVDKTDTVALKRARNTAAARKSRAKKAEEREALESEIARLKAEVEYLQAIIEERGLSY